MQESDSWDIVVSQFEEALIDELIADPSKYISKFEINTWDTPDADVTVTFDTFSFTTVLLGFFADALKPVRTPKDGFLDSEELLKARTADVQMCLAYVRKIILRELEPKIKQTLQEYALEVALRTYSELRSSFTEPDDLPFAGTLKTLTKQVLIPTSIKGLKQRFKLPKQGRPKGSKKLAVTFGKEKLYKKLGDLVRNNYQQGTETTLRGAAEALGLSYGRKLKRLLQKYGDQRDWKTLVAELVAEQK